MTGNAQTISMRNASDSELIRALLSRSHGLDDPAHQHISIMNDPIWVNRGAMLPIVRVSEHISIAALIAFVIEVDWCMDLCHELIQRGSKLRKEISDLRYDASLHVPEAVTNLVHDVLQTSKSSPMELEMKEDILNGRYDHVAEKLVHSRYGPIKPNAIKDLSGGRFPAARQNLIADAIQNRFTDIQKCYQDVEHHVARREISAAGIRQSLGAALADLKTNYNTEILIDSERGASWSWEARLNALRAFWAWGECKHNGIDPRHAVVRKADHICEDLHVYEAPYGYGPPITDTMIANIVTRHQMQGLRDGHLRPIPSEITQEIIEYSYQAAVEQKRTADAASLEPRCRPSAILNYSAH